MTPGKLLPIDARRRIALIQAWSDLFRIFRTARKECDKQLSEERVHALRLATRHCLAVMEVLRTEYPDDARWRRAYRSIRRLLAALGALRDVQVRQLQLAAISGHAPKKLVARLAAEERAARPLVRKAMAKASMPHRDLKVDADEGPFADGRRFANAVRRTLLHRQLRLQERWKEIDPEDPASLHHARVALKRHRYLLLALEPCLDKTMKAELPRLKKVQDALGAWHDAHQFDAWLHSSGRAGTALFAGSAKNHRRTTEVVARLLGRDPARPTRGLFPGPLQP